MSVPRPAGSTAVADSDDLIGMPDGDAALELLIKGADDAPEERWAPLLARLVEVLVARFRRTGMSEDAADKLASASVIEIAHYFGGRMVYLPRGDQLRLALRDGEIFRRSRRGNIQQLAQEYGLTDIQVYRIIRQQQRLHLAKVQGRLFVTDKGEAS